ncbi:MAG: phosphodiester glycosidase family protein [Christensenellaceae bacterium]|nr:phosphodiester glycosidase family protein [Christensenellaceae bacterium]
MFNKFYKSFLMLFIIVFGFNNLVFAEDFDKDKWTVTESYDQNETIFEDFDKGYWFYESDDLRIEIKRYEDKDYKLIWHEADIKILNDKQSFKPYAANPERIGKGFKYAEEIARTNKLVFAINDDQFGHRVYNHVTIGHVVRDGVVMSNKTYRKNVKSLPNLDTMTITDDGEMKVFKHNEYTAEELLAMGYKNVYCFGPIILRDGEINPIFETNYRLQEARSTIGMIEPNHFVVISCEGRREVCRGASLMWVAKRYKELGATQAFNFDGGGTTSLVFMGTKLSFFNPTGVVRKDRALSGLVGIGYSEKVKKWEGVGK